MRRALANEALNLPADALEDAKRAVALDPTIKEAAAAVPRLERAAQVKLEAQKEVMMGKLKDLGDSVLGARPSCGMRSAMPLGLLRLTPRFSPQDTLASRQTTSMR